MILVTGANGQLARELRLLLSSKEALFVDRRDGDITNFEQIDNILSTQKFHSIINCAAYTAVDLAETEPLKAFEVNEKGAENLAVLAKKYSIKLVHISTDYVFSGSTYRPMNEETPTAPISVYGKSKLAGEQKILSINPRGVIVRTSWLYSRFGKNFVRTIVNLGNERDVLKVVYDQVGSPTNAADLAAAIVHILPKIDGDKCEIYHYSNEGAISWYDLAQEIKELRKLKCKIYPIESSQYPLPAPRPYYSVLSKDKIKTKFELEIPYWKESLVKLFESADITF